MELGRGRGRSVSKVVLLCCVAICFFYVCALITRTGCGSVCLDIRSSTTDSYTQELVKTRGGEGMKMQRRAMEMVMVMGAQGRRNLSGPGSYPPRCTSKCGKCTPCRPVHVPVPPGTPVTTEYYPEAWRCKCGNKLYMP